MLKNLYLDSLEASGRYLRIILKEITELELPYTPIVYAVWYEYVSGHNPKLSKNIQAARKKKEQIDGNVSFPIMFSFSPQSITPNLLADVSSPLQDIFDGYLHSIYSPS